MKMQDIITAQENKYKARSERAADVFGLETELTENQVNIAMAIGRRNLMEYSKEEIIKKFVDDEDLIYIGLIEAL